MNCYCFQEGNVYEVNNLYETSFPKLTDQFFKVRSYKNTLGKCGITIFCLLLIGRHEGKFEGINYSVFIQFTLTRRHHGQKQRTWPPMSMMTPSSSTFTGAISLGSSSFYKCITGSCTSATSTLESRLPPSSLFQFPPQHAPTFTQHFDPMNWSPCTVAIQEQGSMLLPLYQPTI